MVSATPLPPVRSPRTRASSKRERGGEARPYLPPELVLVVLERLERADLAACVRVNSGFCQLGLPILHERVHLSEFGAWPVYDDRVVPGPLNQCRPRFMQRGSLVQSTRRVDVHAHTTTRCRHRGLNSSGWAHSLPPLPRLEVLRLFLHPLWSGRRVFHTNVDPRDIEACPSTPCAALSLLHAPTLVVRGLTLVHNTVPRYEICRSLEDSVRRFVCVFEPDQLFFLPRHPMASAHMAGTHFRSRLPAYLNDLTLVFRPPERGAAWRCKSTHTLTWPLIHTYASALWAQVIPWVTQRACDEMPRRLTIVNVGALAPPEDGGCDAPSPSAEAALQHRVHAEFVSAIKDRTGYAEHASRVLEGLAFLTMDEYIASMDEWKDVFEPEEVLTWLRATSRKLCRSSILVHSLHAQNRAAPSASTLLPPTSNDMGTAASREMLESANDGVVVAQGLSPFPPEVIDVILETLDYRSVLALLRVNSVFYKAVVWRMVRRLRVIEVDGLLELEAQHTGARLWLSKPAVLTSRWLPDFIEQLDIYPHAYGAVGDHDGFGRDFKYETHRGKSFGGQRTLFLNNFGTLRLFFGDVDGHQVLHTDVPPYEEQRMTCSLLPHIRAKVLVLRDPSARSLKTLKGIVGGAYPGPSTRQVYVVGPNLVGEHGSVNSTIYLNWWFERADVNVEDIEIVFWTPHGGDWLPIPPGRADEDEWTKGLLQRWFDRLLRTLILSFLFIIDKHPGAGTPRLTLVNAGSIAPLAFADPTDATKPGPWADATARQAAIERMLNEMVWPSSLPPSVDGRHRDRIINAVRFVTMEEWVAAGRWRGVFDTDEIGVEE